MDKMQVYGLGRSRDSRGNVSGFHLNPYTMCIHTLVGAGFPTMQVLVVEVEDEQDEEIHQLCNKGAE